MFVTASSEENGSPITGRVVELTRNRMRSRSALANEVARYTVRCAKPAFAEELAPYTAGTSAVASLHLAVRHDRLGRQGPTEPGPTGEADLDGYPDGRDG